MCLMATTVMRNYRGFRGVDFRGEEVDLTRSPDSLNMWKDYKRSESIRTRPMGKRLLLGYSVDIPGVDFDTPNENETGVGQKIHSLSCFQGEIFIHKGTEIMTYDPVINAIGWIPELGGVKDEPSQTFVYNGNWYFKQSGVFRCWPGGNLGEILGYVPTTSIGRKPSGGGTIHEDVNMLTKSRINTFVGDGESKEYHLDAQNIKYDVPVVDMFVKVNGETWDRSKYTVDLEKGIVTFTEAPPKPATDGQDNVSIKFKAGSDQRHKILGCALAQVFDNRVFFSGNPEYPNMIWHSSLDDPTYVSDLDYYQEGRDDAPVRGMVAGNNALWVFREPSEEQTTVFYHVPTIDADYGKIYPATHSSISTGCVGKAINFNDDIVFFSERGMEGINGDITTEQVIGHRSSLVDRKLIAEADYKNMVLAEWEGYLLVFIGTKVYLADSRAVFTNENHYEYEWFYWELGFPVTCAIVHDGVLYIGSAGGNVYNLVDYGDCESYWVTAKDKFGNPNKLKTTNKRGYVAEATGDVSVYAKVEDTDFEPIGEYKNVTDYFVSRIKRKKWKDIQLKFHSKTRFSLESVTLEAFVGGYIKR